MAHDLPLALATPLVWASSVGPGYLVLRTRFGRSAALLFAFPISLILLHTSALTLQLLTGSISGPGVATVLALIFVAALATSPRRTLRPWLALRAEADAARAFVGRSLRNADGPSWAVAAMVVALIVVVSADFCIDPLRRLDNTFRWGNLAERLFALRTLNFYPPRTAADFVTYFLPDGIAPELSLAFWWCFTISGSSAPVNVLGFVQLEALWLILLVAALARQLGGPPAFRRGAALACCATIPFVAISNGSESGLLAIGTIGALLALQIGRRPDGGEDSHWSYLAVACASVAALAREYGPVTLAMTIAVLIARRTRARELVTALALALVLAGTWYIRTWVRSGNPFYIHEVGGLFPGIPVFTHYLRYAYGHSTLLAMPASQMSRLVFWVTYGAPVAWILGGAVAVRRPRHVTVVFAAAWTIVYLWATSYSAGGYGFALRVASPTIAILTALAASVPRPWLTPARRGLVAAAMALLFVKTSSDLIGGEGGRVWRVPLRQFVRPAEQFPWPVDDRIAAEIRRRGRRVLSANGHLTPAMRTFDLELVPIWSPEVAFLFDPAVPVEQLRSRLRALHLGTYNPVDWQEYVTGERLRTLTETFSSWRPLSATEPALLVEE